MIKSRFDVLSTAGPTMSSVTEISDALKLESRSFRLPLGQRKRDMNQYFINIRNAEKTTGIVTDVYLDLPSSRPRVINSSDLDLVAGESISVVSESKVVDENLKHFKITYFKQVFDNVLLGDTLVLRDGSVVLEVVQKTEDTLITNVVKAGAQIRNGGSCSFPKTDVVYTSITSEDVSIMNKMSDNGLEPDWIVISFAINTDQLNDVVKVVDEIWPSNNVKYMAKIENELGVRNIDEILTEYDGIMIGRGDLLTHIDYRMFPRYQRLLAEKATIMNKKCVIGTQYLEWFATTGVLNRSELNDIASSIHMGADSIMLSMETGNSKYANECIEIIMQLYKTEIELCMEE